MLKIGGNTELDIQFRPLSNFSLDQEIVIKFSDQYSLTHSNCQTSTLNCSISQDGEIKISDQSILANETYTLMIADVNNPSVTDVPLTISMKIISSNKDIMSYQIKPLDFQLACDEMCSTCDLLYSNCTSCIDGYHLFENQCLQTCPAPYLPFNTVCALCDINCLECDKDLKCSVCRKGFYNDQGICTMTPTDRTENQEKVEVLANIKIPKEIPVISIYSFVIAMYCLVKKVKSRGINLKMQLLGCVSFPQHLINAYVFIRIKSSLSLSLGISFGTLVLMSCINQIVLGKVLSRSILSNSKGNYWLCVTVFNNYKSLFMNEELANSLQKTQNSANFIRVLIRADMVGMIFMASLTSLSRIVISETPKLLMFEYSVYCCGIVLLMTRVRFSTKQKLAESGIQTSRSTVRLIFDETQRIHAEVSVDSKDKILSSRAEIST